VVKDPNVSLFLSNIPSKSHQNSHGFTHYFSVFPWHFLGETTFFHPLHLRPSGHGAAVGRWRVTSRGKSTGDVRDMEGVEVEKHGHIIWVYRFHN